MAKKTRPRRPVKKTRKAAPKKIRKTRKVAADILSTEPDPYHIDASVVPEGKAYQWHRFTGASRDPVRDGWVRVPFDRHPQLFPKSYCTKDRHIAYQGLTLLENSAAWVKQQLVDATSFALDMPKQFWSDRGVEVPDRKGRFFPLLPPDQIVTEVLRDAPPEEGPPIDVPISLLIRVPARWASAAAYLKLTLTEYARRRVVGERLTLGCADGMMDRRLDVVYEPVNLKFSPSKEI